MKIKSKKSIIAAIFSLFCLTAFAFDRPVVTNIYAEYSNGARITLMWTNPVNPEKPVTKYIIYRDTKPFTTFDDVNNATYVAHIPGTETGYTDTVKDLNDYFYAVLSFTDECYTVILPAMNATVKGVHVEGKKKNTTQSQKKETKSKYSEGTLRETPLPFLDLIEGLTESENTISSEAVKKASNLGLKSRKEKKTLEPYFFEEDMVSPERGDAYYLFQILTTAFVPGEYEESIVRLRKLTGTNITKEVERRSYFYLGESYYFTGDYENAVRAFVRIQEYFPEETKKWIESSLDHLEF
ncbi:MAG: hypothetical protein MJ182_05935 [Treponema sp.]|nr:hypothetical protein [Treponema sp.]